MKYLSSSKSLQISIGLSILLHLLLALYLSSPRTFKKTENSPISVEFMSPPREEQQITAALPAVKVGPDAAKAGKPETSKTETPPPKPAETPPPPTTENTTETPEPHPLEVPPAPTVKDLTPTLDQLAKIEEEKGEGGKEEETVSLDSTDFKYTSYLHGIKFKIEGVWRYPDAARKSALQGRGLVSFTIERDGRVSDLKLLRSAGYPVLDEAILKAIRDAAPFNPMTENMKVKRLNIVATFEYDLVVQRIWGR